MGTPAGSSRKDAEQEQPIGGIDPNAFDAQMLLIDAYIGNLSSAGISTKAGPTVTSDVLQNSTATIDSNIMSNVPYFTKGFSSVNRLTGFSFSDTMDSINNFITQITPYEIAQIYPKIQFFIVESSTGAQFEIPISKHSDISKVSTGVSFYSTNQMGLKNLSLRLDGSSLAFFAKQYLVDATFVFDSINTFTSRAPGLPITYADIFRSSGRVGTSIYYTKIAISYDSNNEEILNKYALRSTDMSFMLTLQLAITKIKIQENLKLEVSVRYNSREEDLFKSNLIFDFLGLNLQNKIDQTKSGLKEVREKKEALEEAKNNFFKEVREKTKGSQYYKDLDSEYKKKKEIVDKKKQAYDERLARVKKGKDSGGLFTPGYTKDQVAEFKMYSSEAEDLVAARDDLNAIQQRVDNVNNSLTDEELGKKFRELTPGKDPEKDLDDEERSLKNRLAAIRHDEVVKAINQTFPFDEKDFLEAGIVKTIYLTADDVYKYYNSELTKTDAKELSDSSKAGKKKPSTTPTPSKVTVPIKPKPKSGDKKTVPQQDVSRYEQSRDELLKDLGNFKQIDYVTFGDIMRLVYKRLYDVKESQIFAMQGYKPGDEERAMKSIKQSMMLFTEMTFDIFEESKVVNGKAQVDKSIYDIPIAVKNLKYILAKNLYGQQKNFFSIFELVKELLDLISLTRKRKVLLLNDQANFGNYKLKQVTYPLVRNAKGSKTPFQICTNPYVKQEDLYSAMLFFVSRVKSDKPIDEAKGILPEFIFGGVDRGIIKKFELEEITDDDLQKLVMERLISDDRNEIIPSFFKANISTIMAPFLQLSMHIRILAPTLISSAASGGRANFFIDGSYDIRGVTHDYSVGGSFTTNFSAMMYSSERYNKVKKALKKGVEPNKTTEDSSTAVKEFKKTYTTNEGASQLVSSALIDDLKSSDKQKPTNSDGSGFTENSVEKVTQVMKNNMKD